MHYARVSLICRSYCQNSYVFWQCLTALCMRHYELTQRVYCLPREQSLTHTYFTRIVDRPMKQYLDISTLTERLQIKPSTLYTWVAQGTIPHLKLGRLLRFDPDEIEAWLHTHRRESMEQARPVSHRRSSPNHVDDLIAQAKREVYTPSRGKPDHDRATRKGEENGSV